MGTTFNVTVNIADMRYKYDFFNDKQIRRKIYHQFMIQHGETHGGGRYVKADLPQSPIFAPKSAIYDQDIIPRVMKLKAPPHPPS